MTFLVATVALMFLISEILHQKKTVSSYEVLIDDPEYSSDILTDSAQTEIGFGVISDASQGLVLPLSDFEDILVPYFSHVTVAEDGSLARKPLKLGDCRFNDILTQSDYEKQLYDGLMCPKLVRESKDGPLEINAID